MRRDLIEQIVAVEGDNPKEFQDNFNRTTEENKERKHIKTEKFILDNKLVAILTYQIVQQTPDCIADEFHAEGVYWHCRNCPHLDDPNDLRVKYCGCKYSETGRTHKDREACELFYRGVKNGSITPISDRR